MRCKPPVILGANPPLINFNRRSGQRASANVPHKLPLPGELRKVAAFQNTLEQVVFHRQVNHGIGTTTFRQVAVIVSHRRIHGRNISVNCPSRPAVLPLQ